MDFTSTWFADTDPKTLEVYIEMYRSLGGNAVPMAWAETFTAVQQGAIDGLEIPLGIIDQNRYYEVTRFLSLTGHIYSMIGLLVRINRVSPELLKL